MKKKVVTELIICLSSSIIAVILFKILLDDKSLFEKPTSRLLQESNFVYLESVIICQIGLLIYFVLNLIRQFWLKFKNTLCNIAFICTNLVLSGFVTLYIQLLSEGGTVIYEDSLTIYPPLSALHEQSQNDIKDISFAINSLWIIALLLWLITLFTLISTYRNRRKVINM